MNIKPGQSTILTATPLDGAGALTILPPGDIPSWSDPAQPDIRTTRSVDGLSLKVDISSTATPRDVVIQITDGAIASATGQFTLTIVAPAAQPVSSFRVDASVPV